MGASLDVIDQLGWVVTGAVFLALSWAAHYRGRIRLPLAAKGPHALVSAAHELWRARAGARGGPGSVSNTSPTNPWHTSSVEQVFATLGTTVSGLASDEAAKRLLEHGPNELQASERTSAVAHACSRSSRTS